MRYSMVLKIYVRKKKKQPLLYELFLNSIMNYLQISHYRLVVINEEGLTLLIKHGQKLISILSEAIHTRSG